jgi:hypothetical protein
MSGTENDPCSTGVGPTGSRLASRDNPSIAATNLRRTHVRRTSPRRRLDRGVANSIRVSDTYLLYYCASMRGDQTAGMGVVGVDPLTLEVGFEESLGNLEQDWISQIMEQLFFLLPIGSDLSL